MKYSVALSPIRAMLIAGWIPARVIFVSIIRPIEPAPTAPAHDSTERARATQPAIAQVSASNRVSRCSVLVPLGSRFRCHPRRAQACLAQAIDEVLALTRTPVPVGPKSGQIEIVGGHRL